MLRKSVDVLAITYLRKFSHRQLQLATITTSIIGREKSSASKNAEPMAEGKFPTYTPEESNKILQIVNSNNLKELLSYEITKTRANKLLAWQTRNGAFKDLQDILLVEGFGLKVVDKFYRSLLQKPSSEALAKAVRPRSAPFIIPSIEPGQHTHLHSCVSVRIGVSSVTWARLELPGEQATNSPCLLTHWQHHDIAEKKLHLHDLIKRCLYVDHLIPTADCYLFENPQTAQVSSNPGNAEQQNINIQKAQITAVLSYALSSRARRAEVPQSDAAAVTNKPSPTNVFYLRRFLSSRLFNHLIGTERVSSEQTIINLMRTYYNTEQQADVLLEEQHEDNETKAKIACAVDERLSFRGNVQFPAELRHMFSSAERFHREFLGQTLLLNLAFVRLVLLQDAMSIALVTRNANKSSNT